TGQFAELGERLFHTSGMRFPLAFRTRTRCLTRHQGMRRHIEVAVSPRSMAKLYCNKERPLRPVTASDDARRSVSAG
ncbi:MAG TPA: hypothetical protein VE783_09475, partial [Candidatus Limnocylindrales bacterium]|nr:hypothetical protein [Candidatus Limnocylindrales bacterium]